MLNRSREIIFLFFCLSLLSGCHSAEPFRLLGNWSINSTECVIDDSETNRSAIAVIVQTIAERYRLEDETESERLRYGTSIDSMIAAYREQSEEVTPSEFRHKQQYVDRVREKRKAKEISLVTSRSNGKITTFLSQRKWKQGRSQKYCEIQNTLIADFRVRFGNAGQVETYDGVLK